MTTELAVPQDAGIAMLEGIAKAVVDSRMFGISSVAQGLSLMLLAQAEGLHPMKAIQLYDIIQGKPALKPSVMMARYQADGGKIEYIERTPERCTIEFTHPQAAKLRVTWTMDDARRIGLAGKDNWRNYPAPMLQWRCIAEGIRATAPGVLNGMYTSHEVQDFDNEPPGPDALTWQESTERKGKAWTAKEQAEIDAAHAELQRRAEAGTPPVELPPSQEDIDAAAARARAEYEKSAAAMSAMQTELQPPIPVEQLGEPKLIDWSSKPAMVEALMGCTREFYLRGKGVETPRHIAWDAALITSKDEVAVRLMYGSPAKARERCGSDNPAEYIGKITARVDSKGTEPGTFWITELQLAEATQ